MIRFVVEICAQGEYRSAAVAAKKSGDQEMAIKMMHVYKSIGELVEQLNAGVGDMGGQNAQVSNLWGSTQVYVITTIGVRIYIIPHISLRYPRSFN